MRDHYTVLIVDDEEPVLTLLAHQLSKLPYVIIPTSSPAEAIHILETREIALLLCDLNMPDIDGNIVLAAARKNNPNIVSVMITGTEDHEATVRAINEGGIWKYILKPWRRDELMNLVGEGVARYAALCRQQDDLTNLAREITSELEDLATEAIKQAPQKVHKKYKPPRKSVVEKAIETLIHGAQSAGRQQALSSSRYRLRAVLGEGGMGTVYKADDLLLKMPVAVKVLGSQFTRDKRSVAALKEEARIAMQLSHRHIVRIHNLQKSGRYYFLVMEYVNGRNFREICRRYGKLPLATVVQVVRVCADALSYAHRHNVLHCDLKPTNLMLQEDGVLKIIDFGISCLIGAPMTSDEIFGTLAYMSPEQIQGETLDSRTDVYSLGIIAYELLTGHHPFPENATDEDILTMGSLKLADAPVSLREVLEKGVAFDRESRWTSVESFMRALLDAATPVLAAEPKRPEPAVAR
jgi:CheY-like chemotaxis protein